MIQVLGVVLIVLGAFLLLTRRSDQPGGFNAFGFSISGPAGVLVLLLGVLLVLFPYWPGLQGGAGAPTPTTSVATAAPTQEVPAGSSPAPAGTLEVVEVILRADPSQGSAQCPVTVTFSGRISVIGPGGVVAYRFERSDGASAPVQSLTFAGPGSQDVTDTWTLGASGASVTGWEAVQILDPGSARSDQSSFAIACQ